MLKKIKYPEFPVLIVDDKILSFGENKTYFLEYGRNVQKTKKMWEEVPMKI